MLKLKLPVSTPALRMKKSFHTVILLLLAKILLAQYAYHPQHILLKLRPDQLHAQVVDGQIEILELGVFAARYQLRIESVNILGKAKLRENEAYLLEQRAVLVRFAAMPDILALAAELQKQNWVQYAEPDYEVAGHGICGSLPNDKYFNRQWSMYNDGTFNSKSVENADIDMDAAWQLTTGSSKTVVAVFDTGVKTDHPELENRLWLNKKEKNDNNDNDNNGYVDDISGWNFLSGNDNITDDNGHGSNVTGIIAATGNNQLGLAGMDWNCKVMICKVLGSDGKGQFSAVASGLYYAVDMGAHVVNMSLGGSGFSTTLQEAIDYAYDHNVTVVASMGNKNDATIQYPAGCKHVVAVGATDTDNSRSNPFDWGGGSSYGYHISVVAPGSKICGLNYNDDYDFEKYYSGTSQAAPHVAGLVSLMLGLNPALEPDSLRSLLIAGARDGVGLATEDKPGWDMYFGFGLINANATMTLVKTTETVVCDTFWWQGKAFSKTGNYLDTIRTKSGCDSLIALRLKIIPPPQKHVSHTACDSFRWIDGTLYTNSVLSALFTKPGDEGCDSLLFLDLKIKNSTVGYAKVDACGAYTWMDGKTYTKSTQSAWFSIKNHAGCDSLIILHLSITNTDVNVTQNDTALLAAAGQKSYEWLVCQNGVKVPTGNTGAVFVPDSSGSYAVAVSNGQCSDTSACYEMEVINAVNEVAKNEVALFPNPFSERFEIVASQDVSITSVHLHNSLGQLVCSRDNIFSHNYTVETRLPTGVYYATISLSNGRTRLVKVVCEF
ncbi:S8 family serine peptidase [bacterium]|nr:S8 family serine peptidase [bacterium]